MAMNGNFNYSSAEAPNNAASTTSANDAASTTSSTNNLSKDEVAWFFVEQYYTTLSKNPEKLHLFYGKRSQFVYGLEAEIANVSVGRAAIQERIKALDFENCKVRVSNVDSQASFDNIVIQVIGETSNKAGEPKKFVQTFVLAQQPSGYFVLNDILRYIDDGEAEEPADAPSQEGPAPVEPAALEDANISEEAEAPKAESVVEESPSASLDPEVVDQKLEEVSAAEKVVPSVNGDSVTATPTAAEAAAPEEAGESTDADEPTPDPETTAREIEEEVTQEAEKPTDPSPTPVNRQAPSSGAAPAASAPSQPAKPMTWASRIAAAAGPPRAVVPLPKTATPTAAAQSRSAAPTPATASQAPAASSQPADSGANGKDSAEWQTAGSDNKRQNRPQSISGPQEKEGTMGYVKYVTEKVKAEELKAALASYGELVYFDINRQKNCAFVEFASTAGYQAAAAANPHVVNGENIVVEPRRPKAGAYGGTNYNAPRGNTANRGRGGFEGGRSGSQSGGRGGFGGSNRGRGAPRGRGTSQAANA